MRKVSLPFPNGRAVKNSKTGHARFLIPSTTHSWRNFFRKVAGDWLDHEYNPEQAYQMLKDEQRVRVASLAEIKSMLTFCVRGERFSDGHWGEMIEKGFIRRLLERLNEIRSERK